jgi:hypothetical protein
LSGERFSPIRFSLTGADSNFGVLAAKHVRRAAKRKTLFIPTCINLLIAWGVGDGQSLSRCESSRSRLA